MSYNWYCYGQIKENDIWKPFSKSPFSGNLKWYINFDTDETPDCFQHVSFNWDAEELKKIGIAQEFIDEFKNDGDLFSSGNEAFIVRLDKYIEFYKAKIASVYEKLSTIFKCMGIKEDIEWGDAKESTDALIYDNEKSFSGKSVPISKLGILDIAKAFGELEEYQFLLNLATVFESLAFSIGDYTNENKSFLIVRE
jgi:hypothetical protein